jgi:hypothetical protein
VAKSSRLERWPLCLFELGLVMVLFVALVVLEAHTVMNRLQISLEQISLEQIRFGNTKVSCVFVGPVNCCVAVMCNLCNRI